jgi:hypothetical protein
MSNTWGTNSKVKKKKQRAHEKKKKERPVVESCQVVVVGRAVNGRSFDRFVISFRCKRNGMIRYFSFVSITKRLTQLNSIMFQQRND